MPTSSDRLIRDTFAFTLPFAVFMIVANRYPSNFADPATAKRFLWMIGAQVVIACSLLFYFRDIYLRHFPLKFSWLSVWVGAVGVVLWIGICHLQIEHGLLSAVGLETWAARSSFNPFESLTDSQLRTVFLILRFTLMSIFVPIIEEMFLRGWLIRWLQAPDWDQVSLKTLSRFMILTPSIYGVLTHPSEALAAMVWFGLVTWLMLRTGNLWDCVIAHAVTNLLLGIYVVTFSQWHLW